MAKSVNTGVSAEEKVAINTPDPLEVLTQRCITAFNAVNAKFAVATERATLDRNALVAATKRIEALEHANAQLKSKVAALTAKVESVNAVSRDTDPFFVGLEFLREQGGDPTAYVDPQEARREGRRIIAEHEALKNAAPAAPVAPEEELMF